MKTSHPLLGLLLVLWSLRPASAQSQASAPNCATNSACNALFEQGQQQSKSGNLPEAHRLYKLAYEVQPDPALLYSIARVLHKQGQTREAAPFYRRFLGSEIEAKEQRQRASEYLAEIERSSATESPSATPSLRDERSPPDTSSTSLSSPTSGQATEKPLYKKWWFWTLVGGVSAAGVAGLVAGLALREQAPPTPMAPSGLLVVERTF